MPYFKLIIFIMCSGMIFFCYSVPVEDMKRSTIGVEYSGLLSGQTTKKPSPYTTTRFQTHYFMLHYSPVSFLLISCGIGASSIEIMNKFDGKPGLSLTTGFQLISPELIKHISLYGGISVSLINSKKDVSYTPLLYTPNAGFLIYIEKILDLSIGLKGHILTTNGNEEFSNNNYIRGYFAATLHSRCTGSYFTFTFDISPKSSSDWSYTPNEASFGVQVGYLFKNPLRNSKNNNFMIFRSFINDVDSMKKQQKKMSETIKEQE